jgi:hypothetical protein
MNQWTQGYCLTKKPEIKKSRETAPLKPCYAFGHVGSAPAPQTGGLILDDEKFSQK